MPDLKYYFTVLYKDGTIYQQNKEDISIKDPRRSCFYDVDLPNVATFTLSDSKAFFQVDLSDGSFKANGSGSFKIHKEEDLTNFRLIYYRRVTKDIHSHTGELINESVTYHLGWQANTADGKNVQNILQIT